MNATQRFSAKAHTRPSYNYSNFHKSLLHENNADDYALRHIYSVENTKALLQRWGWSAEQIKSSDASLEDFQESYLGQFEDEEDFVYQMWDECGTLKKLEELGISTYYIDWKAIARDWFISDFYSVEVGYKETYVFSRH